MNNENIIEWKLDCFVAQPTGPEFNHYTVKLFNAKVTDIKSTMLNNKTPENIKMPLMEEISFVYQKIEWTWNDGGITASDDLNIMI